MHAKNSSRREGEKLIWWDICWTQTAVSKALFLFWSRANQWLHTVFHDFYSFFLGNPGLSMTILRHYLNPWFSMTFPDFPGVQKPCKKLQRFIQRFSTHSQQHFFFFQCFWSPVTIHKYVKIGYGLKRTEKNFHFFKKNILSAQNLI